MDVDEDRHARIPAGRRAETVLYSLTSALVLGPLLWESTKPILGGCTEVPVKQELSGSKA